MTVTLIILGFIISIIGFIGCILPVLPGPPLSYAALLILSFAKDWEPFSRNFLIWMGIATIVVTVLDYIVPALGAKKYGATSTSVWLSVAGTLIGLVFFPPWGMLFGAFLGALAGELWSGKGGSDAMRSSWGVFVGTLFGIGLKLAASGIMLFYYIIKMF